MGFGVKLRLARILPVLDQIRVATLLRQIPFRLKHVDPFYPLHSPDLNVCEAEKRLI